MKMASKNGGKTAVVPTKTSALPPAELESAMAKYAGAGVSKAQDDNLVPLIYVLQPLSPQIDKRDDKYVEGAEPADIWLRNAATPIVKGEEGIAFQHCFFSIDWVEWVPRDKGGGFVARHKTIPEDAKKTADPQNPNRVRYVRPNGNEVIQTRYHVGYALVKNAVPLPYVIPMSSSGHTVSREWMFRMNQKSLADGSTAPAFGFIYRLRTRRRTNQLGSWFVWDVSDERWATLEEIKRGASLFEAFSSGEKQVEAETVSTDDDTM
jgi:hypothetical protein